MFRSINRADSPIGIWGFGVVGLIVGWLTGVKIKTPPHEIFGVIAGVWFAVAIALLFIPVGIKRSEHRIRWWVAFVLRTALVASITIAAGRALNVASNAAVLPRRTELAFQFAPVGALICLMSAKLLSEGIFGE